ncbi:MAG: cytochrome c [Saprospirales bacterium]|nr:cytochrome c [Saprospirales bacterium]MBK8921549.1 cytochrome c [Saprospirales bacterium]
MAVGGFAAYIALKGIPHYPVNMPAEIASLQVPRDSVRVARGAKIATLLCNECHRGKDGRLVGIIMADVPKEFGTIASYNITQDPVHGIGAWSDGELYYFLRTGIRKDGSWAPPYMPKFPLMANEDVYSIIAWLRSSDPILAADLRENPPNNPNFLVKFLSNTVFNPPPLPQQTIAIPDTANQVAFGRYVADALCACYGCHSADFKTMDIQTPENSAGFYGGGNPVLDKEGRTVPSANITIDKETGIGNWTQQQFYEAVKFNKNPRGGPLYYPMFPHTTLSDTEVNAIWAYLQTVPPIKNQIKRFALSD